ncbi:sensor domain-containing protein [Streptomyces sp. ACA25]|uniref:sensor histidine kinase n=1 Tax=Streptomyces sp. ACA25 TaxID=3022596 RepID=UPI00230779B5|nr:sensor histidine kinase [Streptomyces sp. ACA25]MDB1090363.1 sensor domain-containing protein [Streptomyces sp. ACA25]
MTTLQSPADTAGAAPSRRGWPETLLRVAFGARTWREGLHLLLNFPVAVAAFTFTVVGLAVSGGLLITFVGLPLLGLTLLALRGYAFAERARARGLLGLRIGDPEPLRPAEGRHGPLATMGAVLRSGECWRSAAYALVHFPWAVFTFSVVLTMWVWGWATLLYPVYFWVLDPVYRPGVNLDGQGGGWVWDGPLELALAPLVGLTVLFTAGWVIRALAAVDRLLVTGLLGPSAAETRVRQLESDRSVVLDTSAADLRRIERDLHDGAQARLVALAMDLGLAKEKLTQDPRAAARLVDEAHGEAKLVLQELRDLARSIHPAILTDRGLGPALSATAARCTVPVQVTVDLPTRPAPAIEGITYFTASELLQNISKHSGATTATLDIWHTDDRLLLQITDNGHGGADPTNGTGLTGLTERLAAVDGLLSLTSPPGGPTTLTAALPWHPRE